MIRQVDEEREKELRVGKCSGGEREWKVGFEEGL